ncbi:MAG: hypothetical protein JNJ89_05265 [Rubrivivax sp.]|nr:hypothetical protein [Rubrivivax sp.]
MMAACMLVACGGSGGGPAISRFVAEPPAVQEGATVWLTAHFEGGTATIEPGVGAVMSGVPVGATVADDTTYTLTVRADDGQVARTTAAVTVIYDVSWAFRGEAPGWRLEGAEVDGGTLLLKTHLSAEFGPGLPMQGCSGARAEVSFGDRKLAAGRYQTVDFEFAGVARSGRTSAYPQLWVRHRGARVAVEPLAPGLPPAHLRIEWPAAGLPRLHVDGGYRRDLVAVANAQADALGASNADCPFPGDPGGDSQLRIDSITVRGR